MRRLALLLFVVAAGTVTAAVGASTSTESVTMSVRRYVNANEVRVLVFSGQISSGQAGELVTILGKECTGGLRQLAAAQTIGGGTYQVETPSPGQSYVEIFSGTSLRARWKEAESAPYLYRFGLVPYPLELKRGVVTVKVDPSPLNLKLAGKTVALQRFRGGIWQPYQRAKLKHHPPSAYNHQAIFKVKRGLKLRALVPTATARPCYLAGASKPFTS
jgi:hypothetical protein